MRFEVSNIQLILSVMLLLAEVIIIRTGGAQEEPFKMDYNGANL